MAGVLGFVWTAAWIFLPVEKPDACLPQDHDEETWSQASHLSSMDLLKLPETWSFIVAKFITDPVWWFFLIWLPDYFKKTHGLDIKTSWLHLTIIYGMVSALSLVGGWLPKYLHQRGVSMARARKHCMLGFALAVLPIYFAASQGPRMTVFLIGLAGAAHQAWSANLFTTVSDMFPKPAIARVVGIGGMAGAIGGMIFPVVTGELLDAYTLKGDVAKAYQILFSGCSVAYLVAYLLNHRLAPHFYPISGERLTKGPTSPSGGHIVTSPAPTK
jgi:ACS family hexuronate transporter-like MFS transporter